MKSKILIALLLVVLTIGAVSAADENVTSDDLAINDVYDEVLTLNDTEGTFSDLSTLIESTSSGAVLELDSNYKNEGSGEAIGIQNSITINGKGHKIDADSKSGIFSISGDDVTLKNIKFLNAAHTACIVDGGNCKIINCSFDSCTEHYDNLNDDVEGGVIRINSGSIINCSFTDCVHNVKNTIYGGVLFAENCDIINCSFDNCCVGCDLVYGGGLSTENCDIINCSFDNCGVDSDTVYGGAINSGSSDIRNCVFSHCGDKCVTIYGGAIEGSGNVVNCSFTKCSVDADDPYGGDVHFTGPSNISDSRFIDTNSGVCCNYFCIGNITNCTFVGCSKGAVGFWCEGGNLTGCTFKNCHSQTTVFIHDSFVIISDCIFDNSTACAIEITEHDDRIINCSFINCYSVYNGGAINIKDGENYIINCSFDNCSSAESGGAVYIYTQNDFDDEFDDYNYATSQGVNIVQCSFVKCYAEYGGAVYTEEDSKSRITDSYFEGNTAKYSGGAIIGGIIFDCVLTKNSKPQISSHDDYSTIVPEEIISDDDGGLSLRFPKDAEGNVTVFVDGIQYVVVDIINGIAKIDLSEFKGVHLITLEYSGDDNYNSFSKNSSATIRIIPAIIIVKNLSAIYSSGTKCIITVYEIEGILAPEVSVAIKINNKAFKTLTTGDNGVTSFKITQVPGTYTVQLISLNKTVTKKLTVKHIVSIKTATVKKSAKKLVLTATLAKVNKKYLKNKKITFKFNGKKYTAKTNKKGVAKVTIKSNVLKKLKVGKKVTYQATYLKDTVKKTVKIKK